MTHDELLPDPDTIVDLPDFINALGRLRVGTGGATYRALAKKVGPLLRPPQQVSASTVHDVFSPHRRRLDFDLVTALLGAFGLDAATAERWRQACVRVHAAAKTGGPVGVFGQLPAELATFTGREQELKRLLSEASGSGAGAAVRTVVISAIEGMAGVGKTQLAVHVAHELVRSGRFTEVQLYVNLRGFDPHHAPTDPAAVLEGFLRELGVPGPNIPAGLDERSAMFRDRLHGREALIVLDNAADESQVRDLIPAGSDAMVLITSRRSLAGLDGASLVLLDPYELSEALDLLVKIVGADRVLAEPHAAREIIGLCGGLPLAVALAASRLRSRPRWTCADLARRLRANMVAGLGGDGSRSPWPVFELSYVGLPEPERRLFRLLALHPGQDVTADSVAALAGVTAVRANEGLELLADEHLLQPKQEGRYELHDLLRIYAHERLAADEPAAARAEAHGRVLSWYTVTADAAVRAKYPHMYMLELPASVTRGIQASFADEAEAVAWCAAELPNLTAAAWAAYESGDAILCSRISLPLARLLAVEGQWQDAAKMAHLGLEAAESAGDVAAQALAHHRSAGAIAMNGKGTEESQEHFMAALRLFRSIDDDAGVLDTYVAILGVGVQQPEADFDMAQEALAIARRIGNKVAEANVLFNLAGTLNRAQRPADALEYVLGSLAIVRDHGGRYAIAVNALGAGFTYLALEDYVNAEACYSEAVALFRETGDLYRHIECLHGLARALRGQGRPDEARQTVVEADMVLDSLDAARASQFRQRLESSPSRYSESTTIDPGGRAGAA
ncbi:MAG: tetratricopeptide repeat protein [Catenulispora sp.]|nr:tetratricopeptide repeat protein [Catenulispora sp.]